MFHFTSSLVNSRPVVELDALRRLNLTCLKSGCRLPAFGEHRLRLGCGVVLGQPVID